ncbi:MAG: NADP-dependent oxidoreductase [Gammaproteobacteria bacterium]|nr:NADP-dependent oxidoreductase [Gammaproteobacteria bacterium]
MKAIVINEFGGPNVFKDADVDAPKPLHNEAIVQVHAAGLNPFDTKMRVGKLAPFFGLKLPLIIGWDVAGVVTEVGFDVDEVKVGDRVYGMIQPIRPGSAAEYVAVQSEFLRVMPAKMSFEEAAAIPMAAETAWFGLVNLGKIKKGDRVLVHAGAGGVGMYGIQIAKAMGAWVATTCSTRNVEFCKSLGADQVIDYTQQDFSKELKDIDVAIDVLGGDANLNTYKVLKRGGTLLCVLRYDLADMQNRERLTQEHGVNVHTVVFSNKPAALDELNKLYEAGKLKVHHEVVPFNAASLTKAHEQLESARTRGKLVMKVK